MRKFFSSLHLKDVGFLEMFVALYPILRGYSYGGLMNLEIVALLGIVFISLFKNKRAHDKAFKPMVLLFGYIMLHNFIWLFVMHNVPSYYINTWIIYLLSFISIFIVAPRLDFNKLIGSINWVALFCVAGLFTQAVVVAAGGAVTPIKLPFMPDLPHDSRVYWEVVRPSSFFWEPNAYVSFMLMPLYLSLLKKNYVWSSIIVLSLLLSTSTTGIILSFAIIGFHGLSLNRKSMFARVVVVLMLVMLYLSLTQFEVFEFGLDKLSNTDVTTDSRTANGPTFVAAMPFEDLILGGTYANPGDYYASGRLGSLDIQVYGPDIYMSSLWRMIAMYGILGLFFYLFMYLALLFKCKAAWPYILCLIIELLTSSSFLGGTFSYEMMFVFCIFFNQSSIYTENKK